jgi:hypothetical protein
MDEDDVGSEQLLLAGDALAQDRAVVDDELQVELGDTHTRIAITRCRLAHVAASPSEAEVAALDCVEEQRPIQLLCDGERERGVALELGQPEAGSKRADDRAHEIREDVLRVIELDAREVARVPRDVGEQETGRLSCHRRTPWEPGPASEEYDRLGDASVLLDQG